MHTYRPLCVNPICVCELHMLVTSAATIFIERLAEHRSLRNIVGWCNHYSHIYIYIYNIYIYIYIYIFILHGESTRIYLVGKNYEMYYIRMYYVLNYTVNMWHCILIIIKLIFEWCNNLKSVLSLISVYLYTYL